MGSPQSLRYYFAGHDIHDGQLRLQINQCVETPRVLEPLVLVIHAPAVPDTTDRRFYFKGCDDSLGRIENLD